MERGKDIIGQKFGRLTVKRFECKSDKGESYYFCDCECGNSKIVKRKYLIDSSTKSCGCLRKERAKQLRRNNNKKYSKEKSSQPHWKKLKNVWNNMIHRCHNPNDNHYKWYGEKGITVCDEWKADFELFYNWSIENGYEENLSIDRIDVDGQYSPDNCEWATHDEQCNNMSSNVLITYKNRTMTPTQWEEETGINAVLIRTRYQKGIRGKKLFEAYEPFVYQKIEINGEIKTAKEWASHIGIKYMSFKNRYDKGLRGNDLIKITPQIKGSRKHKGVKRK